MTGTVFNIQRYCTNDGPGIRTTVFLKGCPLNCRWCHNPESKSAHPQILFSAERCLGCGACAAVCPKGLQKMSSGVATASSPLRPIHAFVREGCVACGACARSCSGALELVGEERSVEDILAIILRDKSFYGDEGGMTVSGGEPFAQPDFLLSLLAAAKEKGIGTAVETSGFADEKDIRASLPLVDWYLYDCKETDSALHRKWTGVDNERILANLAILNEANAQVVLRCPIVPGCNDREDHFKALGEMSRRFPCVHRIEVLSYHPLGVRKSRELGQESLRASIHIPGEAEVEDWKGKIKTATRTLPACPVRKG